MSSLSNWFSDLPPAVAAAVVAAVVSLITTLATTFIAPSIKYGFDKRLENRKLELAYQSEQRKALRDHIAHHKGRFLEAADSFSHRLWNYERNQEENWLDTRGRYSGTFGYYTKTFAYRFLLCIGTARLLEREAMYIDAQFAKPEDYTFLKAIKLTILVWTDTDLFDHIEYDASQATDHFYKDDLVAMADSFFEAEDPMSLKEFTAAVRKKKHPYIDVFRFFDGLKAGESRHRHNRVVTAHLVLIVTLNSFGYSFQKTKEQDILTVVDRMTDPCVLAGLRTMIDRLDLRADHSFKELLEVIERKHHD